MIIKGMIQMKKASERILQSIKASGISYGTLSKLTGISKSALQRYAMGQTEKIPAEKLEKIALALNSEPGYFMGWNDGRNEKTDSAEEAKRIPVLGRVAAGMPIYAQENIEEYIYTSRGDSSEYFALRVQGDSMNAIGINDGGILTVHRQDSVENGQIAVVLVNDENATVKRFYRDKNIVQLVPQSYNPEHRIQIYDLKRDNVRVQGRVVECRTEFDG